MMKRKMFDKTQTTEIYGVSEKNRIHSRGKQSLKKLVNWLLVFLVSSFIGGYIGRLSEPVYRVADLAFLYATEWITSAMGAEGW